MSYQHQESPQKLKFSPVFKKLGAIKCDSSLCTNQGCTGWGIQTARNGKFPGFSHLWLCGYAKKPDGCNNPRCCGFGIKKDGFQHVFPEDDDSAYNEPTRRVQRMGDYLPPGLAPAPEPMYERPHPRPERPSYAAAAALPADTNNQTSVQLETPEDLERAAAEMMAKAKKIRTKKWDEFKKLFQELIVTPERFEELIPMIGEKACDSKILPINDRESFLTYLTELLPLDRHTPDFTGVVIGTSDKDGDDDSDDDVKSDSNEDANADNDDADNDNSNAGPSAAAIPDNWETVLAKKRGNGGR